MNGRSEHTTCGVCPSRGRAVIRKPDDPSRSEVFAALARYNPEISSLPSRPAVVINQIYVIKYFIVNYRIFIVVK